MARAPAVGRERGSLWAISGFWSLLRRARQPLPPDEYSNTRLLILSLPATGVGQRLIVPAPSALHTAIMSRSLPPAAETWKKGDEAWVEFVHGTYKCELVSSGR